MLLDLKGIIKNKHHVAILYAILAAALYAVSSPISKLLLKRIDPTMMAGFLYLGAGVGMFLLFTIRNVLVKQRLDLDLSKKELPYLIGMVILDIAAPIFLMFGLKYTTAANVSLLNTFEIVATSIIAFMLFKEVISKRLWIAIFFITMSSMILSFEDMSSLSFSLGSIFVILACICWGFENNYTRALSEKEPFLIVIIKGLGSGSITFLIGLLLKEEVPHINYILIIMLLGFLAYGLSIFFYVHAQRNLGAAKTSAYYAVAPFIGVFLSILIFREMPNLMFVLAFLVMIIGTYLASTDQCS
ncbi:DMT family transporter [Anaeromicropila herbilytica]|uniref:Membrane protein n=1 Tax=Anaeromicropila herbilytica TaxID=2785025 RepID=A0A7R7EJW6_9FIRM|nr:DMT family transporter [Anaeromicropila herbilytica]BCN30089.1 membrane protein [Anaeromicropila herbilytica]